MSTDVTNNGAASRYELKVDGELIGVVAADRRRQFGLTAA